MSKSRFELLMGCLATRRVASQEQLYTLAYQPQGLSLEQLAVDLMDSNEVTKVLIEDKEYYCPNLIGGMKINRRITHPRSSQEATIFAAISGVAAYVMQEGAEWLEFPRKQFDKSIPRHVRGYTVGQKTTLVVADPTFDMASRLSKLAPLLVLYDQCKDSLNWNIENVQVMSAQSFL